MKKILLTGATGFIGSQVTNELVRRGYEVHAIVYQQIPVSKENVIYHELNLFDDAAVDKFLSTYHFENLIHLAWYVGPKCHVSDLNMDWMITTLNLIKLFQKYGGKTYVGAGTCSEYEYKYGYLLEDETPTDSETLYGNCKNAVYNIAKVFCRQHGIIFKWARIFNLYGPNEKPQRLMPSVINSCLKGEDVKVSNCLKFQDYLHVEDTATGIVDLFESDMQGAVNISSGQPVQLKYIVNRIAELTGFKGNILWGEIPPAFGEDLIVGNNDKLKSIGWKPKYTLEEGLKQTINWWKQHNEENANV